METVNGLMESAMLGIGVMTSKRVLAKNQTKMKNTKAIS